MQPAFATVRDWARLSGVSRTRTFALLNSGDLKAHRVGNRVLIDVEAGLEWLRSRPSARPASGETSARA